MRYAEAALGRVFILRLEDGEVLHETVEAFARQRGVTSAVVFCLGGADDGSRIVVGPEEDRTVPVVPVMTALAGVHEMVGVGTVFPDEKGEVVLHLHGAFGRGGEARAGCCRTGVRTWHVLEVIVLELTGSRSLRRREAASGFSLLQPL